MPFKLVCPQRHINKFESGKSFLTCTTCNRFCRVKAERKISAIFVVGKQGVREEEIPGDLLTIADDDTDEDIMNELVSQKWKSVYRTESSSPWKRIILLLMISDNSSNQYQLN